MPRHCLVLSTIVFVACQGTPTSTVHDASADAAEADADPIDDPSCHYDCPTDVAHCLDGEVSVRGGGEVPCRDADPMYGCLLVGHQTCAEGCRTDGIVSTWSLYDVDPGVLCEENRPPRVGDPCLDETGCRPEVGWDYYDGTVMNVYLACDPKLGACVARDAPPTPPDLMQSCGLVPADFAPGPGGPVVIANDTCSTATCLAFNVGTCVYQGCTSACTTDGDCPIGTLCKTVQAELPTVCLPSGDPIRQILSLPCPE